MMFEPLVFREKTEAHGRLKAHESKSEIYEERMISGG